MLQVEEIKHLNSRQQLSECSLWSGSGSFLVMGGPPLQAQTQMSRRRSHNLISDLNESLHLPVKQILQELGRALRRKRKPGAVL